MYHTVRGFAALAAGAGAASAIPDDPKNPFLWVRMESDHVLLSYQESVLPVNYAPLYLSDYTIFRKMMKG